MIAGATPVASQPATDLYRHLIDVQCFRLYLDSEYLRLSIVQCFTNFRSPISSIDHDNGVRWSYITAVICHHHYIWKSRQPGLNRTKPVTLAETPGWRKESADDTQGDLVIREVRLTECKIETSLLNCNSTIGGF